MVFPTAVAVSTATRIVSSRVGTAVRGRGEATVLLRRCISKAARRRKSKRYATFFHPPYLATPEYSQKGHDLVHSFGHYHVLDTVDDVTEWALQAQHELQLTDNHANSASFTSYLHPSMPTSTAPLFVGLDVGWNFHRNARLRAPTHTLHISLPSLPTADATTAPLVASLHLSGDSLAIRDASDVPDALRRVLQHASVLPCGVQINRDAARLARKFNICIDQRVELDQWAVAQAQMLDSSRGNDNAAREDASHAARDAHVTTMYQHNPLVPKVIDMAYLCRHFLVPPVEVEPTLGHDADYSAHPLPTWLMQYGALEAWHSRQVAYALYQRHWIGKDHVAVDDSVAVDDATTDSTDSTASTVRQPKKLKKLSHQQQHEAQLHVGQVVDVYFDGTRPVGRGVVEFMGGHQGLARTWGQLLVNRGKALVRLDAVYLPYAIPTFNAHTAQLYLAPNQSMPWDGKVRLQDIFLSHLPVVACTTLNLKAPPSEGNEPIVTVAQSAAAVPKKPPTVTKTKRRDRT